MFDDSSSVHPPQAVYDRLAARYDELWSCHVVEPQRRLTQVLGPRRGERVLDLACGTGIDTIEMLKRVAPAEVVAVDCSSAMLRAAVVRARAVGIDITAICREAEAVLASVDAASFDIVSLRFCLSYLDWRAILPRLSRVMRRGARVGILTSLNKSVRQALAAYARMKDDLGLPAFSPTLPDSTDQISEALARGGLRLENAWHHQFRLWFDSAAAAATWLSESGCTAHAALQGLAPHVIEPLRDAFIERLSQLQEPNGIPLDFDLAGVVAIRP